MPFSILMLHTLLGLMGTLCLVSDLAGSPGQGVPVAAFTTQVALKLGSHAHEDIFEVSASVTRGVANHGMLPCAEEGTLTVGTFATTIPAGAFRPEAQGQCSFVGVIDGVRLVVLLWPLGRGRYQLHAVGTNADLTGTVNPVAVGWRMGHESGRTTVAAQFL